MSELILYTSDDGQTKLHLRVETETVWLSQLEIAALFQTTKQNVSLHAKNIFDDNELTLEATVKESLTVQSEGGRQVKRKISYYNLGHRLPRSLASWCAIPPMGQYPPQGVFAQGLRDG